MTIPSVPIPPSRYPIAADNYHTHFPQLNTSVSPGSFGGRSFETGSPNSLISSPKTEESPIYNGGDFMNGYPMFNWSYKQNQTLAVQPIPALNAFYRPRRLEEIAPRDTVSLIIALFFDFVYPLTPCVHKPSFMADLHARREERDPLFFALVMSTVASTLVQVPRSYLPMERPVVRKLAQVGTFL